MCLYAEQTAAMTGYGMAAPRMTREERARLLELLIEWHGDGGMTSCRCEGCVLVEEILRQREEISELRAAA